MCYFNLVLCGKFETICTPWILHLTSYRFSFKVRFLRKYLEKGSDPKICKNGPPTQLGIDGAVFANFWITTFFQVRS